MGCACCMWQLVFADIINNNKLSILYCNLPCFTDSIWYDRHLIHVCYVGYLMVHMIWLYLWPDCTLDSSTDYLYYCLYMLLQSWWSAVLLSYCTPLLYMHEHIFLFFLYTHCVWICTSRYWMFYFFDQVFIEIICFTRTRSFFLFDLVLLSSFLPHDFYSFLDFIYIRLISGFILLFTWNHVWTFICSITVISILFNRFLHLARVTLELACIRGVFSSRIYVIDSRRDSISAYFGKQGVIVFKKCINVFIFCYQGMWIEIIKTKGGYFHINKRNFL